jgi:hypothetical protein
MNGPTMNNPLVNIPATNGSLANGSLANGSPGSGSVVKGTVVGAPARLAREYTGKHRRDAGIGSLSPWSRPEPDGSGPRPGGER